MIFVSVGTHKEGFDRLIKEIDFLVEQKIIKDKVFAQIGNGKFIPKNITFVRFMNEDEMEKQIKKCNTYITHGGVGSISLGLSLKKRLIILPRLKKYSEAIDNHQIEIATELEKTKQAIYCKSEKDIKEKLKQKTKLIQNKNLGKINDMIKNFITTLSK